MRMLRGAAPRCTIRTARRFAAGAQTGVAPQTRSRSPGVPGSPSSPRHSASARSCCSREDLHGPAGPSTSRNKALSRLALQVLPPRSKQCQGPLRRWPLPPWSASVLPVDAQLCPVKLSRNRTAPSSNPSSSTSPPSALHFGPNPLHRLRHPRLQVVGMQSIQHQQAARPTGSRPSLSMSCSPGSPASAMISNARSRPAPWNSISSCTSSRGGRSHAGIGDRLDLLHQPADSLQALL